MHYPTYQDFLIALDKAVSVMTGGTGLGHEDFGDTVYTRSAWEEGKTPMEVAEEILRNDTIGSAMLDLYLSQ